MSKREKALFGILIIVFLIITLFSAANINAVNDTFREASPAYGKKVPELQVTESIPYSKEDFHLYLFIGQSNMSGKANIEDEDQVIIGHAYLFNKEEKWEPAQPGIVQGANPSLQGYNRYSTVGSPKSVNGLNPAHTFAKVITQNKKDIGVGIISNAIGGTQLRQWQKGSGSNYFEEAVRRTKEAMKYGTLKGIIWHQGEGDRNNPQYLEYPEKLKVFVADLREALGVNPDTVPFLAGQCLPNDKYGAINNQIANIKNFVPNSDYISSSGMTDKGDKTHFDSKSQRILGERYAAKILKMVYAIEIPEESK
jgi:hypothetical protein